MAVISEILRAENDGSLSFGNYLLDSKTKVEGFEHRGDIYKVKTFKDITRLEKNDTFVFESVPGSAVSNLTYSLDGVRFTIEGPEDTQITLELYEDTTYSLVVNGEEIDEMTTSMSGKLSFSVGLEELGKADVEIKLV